jgi:P4 family phage/plasmid primase-like protien
MNALVSCVKSAKDTETQDYDAKEIIESIRADKHFKLCKPIANIRSTFWSVLATSGNNRKAAKEAVATKKKGLPGVLWSGRFRSRKKDDLDQHSGLLCADLDELGDQLADVRSKLLTSSHLWALFTSPTGDGLKCVFRVQADANTHKASFRAVEEHVHKLSGIQIDKACSDVARLCFLSHDPDAYLNDGATELPPLMEVEKSKPVETTDISEPDIKTRRDIAAELLGTIDWETETHGFCACPAHNLHTTGDGRQDCKVYLNGVPTIHCFHDHCRGIVEAKNHELRSRIAKTERALASTTTYPTNDTERAERFAAKFKDELRYVKAWKRWVVWDGVRWNSDTDGAVLRKAQEMPKLFLQEAAEITNDDCRRRAAIMASRAGDRNKIEAMISLAECQLEVAASPTLFDSDPLLLGVSNGVVDLRTGTFRQARKEDYLIKQAGTGYDPTAICPRWEKFVSRILCENADLVSFVQRAVGYTLTGLIDEQVLFFLYGTGQNGKSTFVECLQQLLGSYMIKTTTALYTIDRHGKEPETEIARLVGKRLVTGSETEEGAKLAESRVKDITGGDTLTGRELYCAAFNFKPTHKLWIYGNHRPDVRGNDLGIWRRMRLLPFEVQIPEQERDSELLKKLLQEMPGILNWAIKGCLEWQKDGLGTPKIVTDATTDYREEEDVIGEFIEERCVLTRDVERGELYAAYKVWAECSAGIRWPLGPKAFAKRLRRPGISERKSGERYWVGISLASKDDKPTISFRKAA